MRDKGVLAYAKGKKLTAFADSRKIFSHYPAFSIQLSPILHPSSSTPLHSSLNGDPLCKESIN
jgi:hypothetical protein